MFRFCKRNFYLRREEFSLFCGSENSFKSIGSCLFPPRTELLTFSSVLSVKVCLWAITFSVWRENISSVPAPFFYRKGITRRHIIGCSTGATFYKVSWNFFVIFIFDAVRFLSKNLRLINTSCSIAMI